MDVKNFLKKNILASCISYFVYYCYAICEINLKNTGTRTDFSHCCELKKMYFNFTSCEILLSKINNFSTVNFSDSLVLNAASKSSSGAIPNSNEEYHKNSKENSRKLPSLEHFPFVYTRKYLHVWMHLNFAI